MLIVLFVLFDRKVKCIYALPGEYQGAYGTRANPYGGQYPLEHLPCREGGGYREAVTAVAAVRSVTSASETNRKGAALC